jgi:hypothetical protein
MQMGEHLEDDLLKMVLERQIEQGQRLAVLEKSLENFERTRASIDAALARKPPQDEPRVFGLTGRQVVFLAIAATFIAAFGSATVIALLASGHGAAIREGIALLRGEP